MTSHEPLGDETSNAAEQALRRQQPARTARQARRRKVDTLRSLSARAYLALRSAHDREDGQALVEYALILFLVALVSITILGTLGGKVSSMFNQVSQDF
jgi:Flp pilus assembly pilin Flp